MSNLTQTFPAAVRYLRISLTDRCNLSCLYCRAGESGSAAEVLTPERVERFAGVLKEFGLRTVRLTGGEPLLRPDAVEFVRRIARRGLEVALTTNGLLLEKYAAALKEAGLRRLNVSLDALDPEKYAEISGGGDLRKVLKGIDAALRAGFEELKLNAVAVKNFTEAEVDRLLEYAAVKGLHLRFVELMPVGRLPFFTEDRFLPLDRIKELIEKKYGRLEPLGRGGSGASEDHFLPSLGVKVGFIRGVSKPFCAGCAKLRLTADGRVRFCLRTDREFDVTPYLDSEEELRKIIPLLLEKKRLSNLLAERLEPTRFSESRTMISIGG
ncbi:MAG: GTP 3',8-cyclase MoaA [Aquificae bacterium]|nr:GTP 3',8-cyclase MoaA [Aquificota bacterium]